MARLSIPVHDRFHHLKAPAFLREEADIPSSVMSAVHERDRGLCQYCLMQGRMAPGEVYDHFIPVRAGGEGIIANVQLACVECVLRKWHRHPRDVYGPDWKAWAPGKPRHPRPPGSWP